MDDIINSLVQDIERGAFLYYFARSEYQKEHQSALAHYQWLEEHLGSEEKAHLARARDADTYVDTFEREALIRTAIAVGIRLTLSC